MKKPNAVKKIVTPNRDAQMKAAIQRLMGRPEEEAEVSDAVEIPGVLNPFPPKPDPAAEAQKRAESLAKAEKFLAMKKDLHTHEPMDSEQYLQKMLGIAKGFAPNRGENVQFSYDAPASDDQIKHQFDIAGMLDADGEITRRDIKSTEHDNYGKLRDMVSQKTPGLDLRSLADFGNMMSTSGRKITAREPSFSADDQVSQYSELTKAMQAEKDNEMKRQMEQDALIMDGIQKVQGHKGSIGYSKSHPPLANSAGGRHDDRLMVTMGKELDADRTTRMRTKLEKVADAIGLDPEDNSPIPGLHGYGIGNLERNVPNVLGLNPGREEASETYGSVTENIASFIHELYGASVVDREAKMAEAQTHFGPTGTPRGLRQFVLGLAEEAARRIDTTKEHYPDHIVDGYESKPNASRSEWFRALRGRQKQPHPTKKPQAPAAPTAPAGKAPATPPKGVMSFEEWKASRKKAGPQ